MLYVAALTLVEPRVQPTLPVLYVPIITLAAVTSLPAGFTVAVGAAIASRATLALEFGATTALEQSILPVVVVAFLVVGTRYTVATLERSLERLKRVAATERQAARRLRAIQQVGGILAQDGPTPATLERIMDVLVGTFGYLHPSLYLWDGQHLRLGAQRGYENPIYEFDPSVGIIGRVARTREAVFAPDVSKDPDYQSADPDVVSEISVPLLADGELLGVLNVESTAAEPLNRADLASMRTIADRLSASIALGRERQALAERAALLGRLTAASVELVATLDPAILRTAIAAAGTAVITADASLVTLLDESGDYRIAATVGAEPVLGIQIHPGEGATGQAIERREAVLEDRFDKTRYPKAARRGEDDPTVAVMAIPMLRDDVVVGALTFVRNDLEHPFTEQEREIAHLLAAQATLAITNAALLQESREAALRDPLTRLHNRRLLDDAMERMSASRARQSVAERRPLAAILFDLDHFGALNKRHGHQVGDTVLKSFAALLGTRFRASDLVTRFGGEEFLVILEGASRDDAMRAAEDIRRAFAELEIATPSGDAIQATVSAGCAAIDESVAATASLVEVADVGLAMAKAAGRNQVVAA